MKQVLSAIFLVFLLQHLPAQNTFRAIVESEDEDEPELLQGAIASIPGTIISAVADSNGLVVLQNIPDGTYIIEFSFIGYFKHKLKVVFPLPQAAGPVEIQLQSQTLEVEEVIITTTRNYQNAEYIPTRVEVIGEEEVDERAHDKPSDVSHVIREQPGVQVQRTSATAGTMAIRLQGLSSRYVQVLKDGFPVYGGFSKVLGITQIPPLDLKQVEIIKGPSSILYGSDAISGVINVVSKEPSEKPVYDLMVNGESALAVDAGLFASQKVKWFGFSLMGLYRYQNDKDWDGDRFSETPRLDRYAFAPQLFFDIGKHAKLNLGTNYTYEDRIGGAQPYLNGEADSLYNYFEKNLSNHISTNFKFEYDFGEGKGKLTARNSFNIFNRELSLPFYFFKGRQLASNSELVYRLVNGKHNLVAGADFRTDELKEANDSSTIKRNYAYHTLGGFGQYMYHLDEKTTLEVGLRFDYFKFFKLYVLPHLAALHKWNQVFSTRLNLGMGYKLPTIFQEATEEARFINIMPVANTVKPEFSIGGTVDLKVKLPSIHGLNITITQLYFLTHILQPVVADTFLSPACTTGDCIVTSYKNAEGFIQSLGVENGLYLNYRNFSASLVYSLTDNHRRINGVKGINPLTSKHIISILAGYESKHFFIGIDCYYYSPVRLTNGGTSRRIWEVGINAQYAFRYFSVFANFENIANNRQTRWGRIAFPNPTLATPRFAEIYGPLEGRLLNVGIKLHIGAFLKKGAATGVERLKAKEQD